MNRGITKHIKALIASGRLGNTFRPEEVADYLQADLGPVNNALSRLARMGDLKPFGTRVDRSYQLAEAATPAVLEDLLSAMAKAEPVLRQAIKIMRAVEGAKSG